MKILITGASGFIGRAAVEHFGSDKASQVVAATRKRPRSPVLGVTYAEIGDVGPGTVWREALAGIDLIIHTAAHVHTTNRAEAASDTTFETVNVEGTLNLARQAIDVGVKRFLFLSSIKVNGDATQRGKPFSPQDEPAPTDSYGKSKHEAEVGLRQLSQTGDMEVVVIRPPLVYGPGVRANFLMMMRWIYNGWPIPLGRVNNRRSLVALDNLVDLIATCAAHPAAANQIFTVSDDEDVSTGELVRRIGAALQKPARLVPIPLGLLRTGASLAGKRSQAERLLSSLQVDISKTRSLLSWSPITSMEKALKETACHYLEAVRR